MRHGSPTACALPLVLLCASAAAKPTSVRLNYQTDPSIPDCPDLVQLKRAVEARLGAEPWDPAASREVRVRVTRAGDERRASVDLRDQGGALLGQRVLRSKRADCRELAEAMALAISIAIDPLSVRRAPESQPLSRAVAPSAAAGSRGRGPAAQRDQDSAPVQATAGLAVRQPPAERGRLKLALSAEGSIAIGAAPAPAGSLRIAFGVRWRFFSAAAEARVDFPAFDEVEGGRVSTWLAGGSLVGCGHYRWLRGCALLTAAALTATGHELLEAQSSTRAYAGAGARGGLEVPLLGRLALTLDAEILIPFARVHLVDARSYERFWSTPAASGSFGLGLLVLFR